MTKAISKQRFLITILVSELALLLIAAVLVYLFLDTPIPIRVDVRALIWGLSATLPPLLFIWFIWSRAGQRLPLIQKIYGKIYERLREILGEPLIDTRLWQIVMLSLAAGIGEEVLFRGVIQPLIGILGASFIFAVLHALTAAYFWFAMALGLYLGWVFETSGNLLVPIAVHTLYDIVALLVLRESFIADSEPPSSMIA